MREELGKFYLNNPELERGKPSKIKILRIIPDADMPIENILTIFKDTVNLYKIGVVKLK